MQFSMVIVAFAATAFAQSQIKDGQVQGASLSLPPASTSVAPKAAVTQITDGQIQAAPTPKAGVTQITDGQIQAPKGTAPAASGVAPTPAKNGTIASPSPSAFKGAAPVFSWSQELAMAAAGVVAVFAL